MVASDNEKTELRKQAEVIMYLNGIDQPCHRLMGPFKARKQKVR